MRTALVLSAGGMFGSWQVGVWKGLASRFQPDMVIGASAGALNGWAIAGRVAPDELAAAWLDPAVADLIRPHIGWSLFDPVRLRQTARLLFERYRPSMPFAATLVEVPRLRLRLAMAEQMRWEHLAATCSFPLGFPPVRLDGRWYVDGGLLGALPLWAAAELGADRAIAIDALPVMPSRIVMAAARTAHLIGRPKTAPAGFPVTLIRPGVRLGRLRDALYWNPENARRWLAQGERDAELSFTM